MNLWYVELSYGMHGGAIDEMLLDVSAKVLLFLFLKTRNMNG
jgi:hypothetical protein